MLTFIFDLDGTVIDSSHRKSTRPDGTLDLAHWIENSTPEKVAADTLLPVSAMLFKAFRQGHTVLICTARVMSDADFEFLMANGINSHGVLSRPEGCTMGDAELKEIQLRLYAQRHGLSWAKFCETAIMLDDAPPVITRMREIGIDTLDAVRLNERLAA